MPVSEEQALSGIGRNGMEAKSLELNRPLINAHGGDIAGFFEKYGEMPLDFSSNISPLLMPEGVKSAVKASLENASFYPDPDCRNLRKSLSELTGISKDLIFCGNGAADIIYRFAFAMRFRHCLVTAPTFSEYGAAFSSAGTQVHSYLLKEENGFVIQRDILSLIDPGLDVLVLCEPNNPTGVLTPPGLLEEIADACRENKVFLVIDECFADFVPDHHSLLQRLTFQPMLILRAFTKFYALAGLRLGYCLCSSESLACALKTAGPPWNVSAVAQTAGIAALEESGYSRRVIKLVTEQRAVLKRQLESLGCRVISGRANYLLFSCEDPALAEKLESRSILIRSCSDYEGLGKNWFRIAVKLPEENEKLIEEMKRVLWHGQ